MENGMDEAKVLRTRRQNSLNRCDLSTLSLKCGQMTLEVWVCCFLLMPSCGVPCFLAHCLGYTPEAQDARCGPHAGQGWSMGHGTGGTTELKCWVATMLSTHMVFLIIDYPIVCFKHMDHCLHQGCPIFHHFPPWGSSRLTFQAMQEQDQRDAMENSKVTHAVNGYNQQGADFQQRQMEEAQKEMAQLPSSSLEIKEPWGWWIAKLGISLGNPSYWRYLGTLGTAWI